MSYAIIENTLVINSVEAEADYAAEQGWVLLPKGAGIGWAYIDGEFVDLRPDASADAAASKVNHQTLLDITTQTDPSNIAWPVSPSTGE
jgi:hypothetical protein